ncbi:CubicO group peptidase (beta-lactamase class C family) [Nonomuraea muscovyensis]|uniref:CubicO group peptidase (Beta-lactamase class C family) n=1 Tax=Nonomuraea muscovyensis TaxID=1124761 RepID=A0A7X0C3C9_9ACTN|nr:serine hydrolase domain-containing protein [Nonomuraea muscovyensis]MBB6346891.1 CubicO group peptidase (beta-lactamase class C family) [Nonomuraea muscovyensis]
MNDVTHDHDGTGQAAGDRGASGSGGEHFPVARWQARLDELRAAHHVPGATLAVLTGGRIHELASGVLHRGTGVEVRPGSIFQSGSIAKVYTATLVMRLVDEGLLRLDQPVAEVLPEFGTPDEEATRTITIRRLLSHTGGLTNDFTHDSGRGDDCLARYVEAARGVPLDCPPGTALSYGSLGYVVLGRVVEVLTGLTWDQALKERLFAPLGLEHSMTLPEEALRFRVAMSHLGEAGRDPDPAPAWDLMPRSAGPYGRVLISAGDVARFARMHLDGGTAPDGTRVLSAEAVAAMQRREADVPDKWTVSADGWGLGWTLYDWDGVTGYGHDGAAIGQYAYLRVVPGAGVAVVLLTNGGAARRLYADLFGELLAELAGVTMPPPFGPPAQPPAVDLTPHLGTYRREGVVITVSRGDDGAARLRYEFVDGMKDFSPPLEADLTPVSEAVFAASGAGSPFGEDHMPVVFAALSDGTPCVYVGMRATPKVA